MEHLQSNLKHSRPVEEIQITFVQAREAGEKKTLPVMLGSIETCDLVNHFKLIQAEELYYNTSQQYRECFSSVKLRHFRIKETK